MIKNIVKFITFLKSPNRKKYLCEFFFLSQYMPHRNSNKCVWGFFSSKKWCGVCLRVFVSFCCSFWIYIFSCPPFRCWQTIHRKLRHLALLRNCNIIKRMNRARIMSWIFSKKKKKNEKCKCRIYNFFLTCNVSIQLHDLRVQQNSRVSFKMFPEFTFKLEKKIFICCN